ncbi:MAG TPA: hypothetical protein VHU79_09425 [Sphingomicrobium sp.]|jgi:hypothetical protein|nr:hypothetical protein [Sphingomicrobium sp.]
MRFRVPVFTFVLMVVIAACGKHGPVANGANEVTAVPVPVNASTPTPEGAPPENGSKFAPEPPDSAVTATIPATLQGRWGLTPQDCTLAPAQARGQLVINAGGLRFYESLAAPSNGVQADNQSISGNFNFRGEGKTWARFESLKRSGDKLTRTEADPAASYTYAKC